jgi:CP family cyanate transporter-like MFS transporter
VQDRQNHEEDRRRLLLIIGGMLLVAINLRTALASVGPLVDPIMQTTGLSATAFGLLTTLPLIAFGVVSPLTPAITRRAGLGGALVLALLLIFLGTALRPLAGSALLFLGTAALGIGVALGNVLMPALVKSEFPASSGSMTSLYSSVMGIGATIAAGTTVPLSRMLGWRGALALWAVPAAVALLLWLPRVRPPRPQRVQPAEAGGGVRALGRSPLAWQVALFMGFQSLTFYVVLAWLPDMLQARGIDAAGAGWLLALSQATGIAGSAIVPFRAARRAGQKRIVLVLGVLEALSLLGLLLASAAWLHALAVGVLGFAMGGTFSLSLLFLVLRAPDTRMATSLSGMAQSIGYLVAAAGPALIGYVRDATGSWTGPILCLFAALAAKAVSGLGAARDRLVAG